MQKQRGPAANLSGKKSVTEQVSSDIESAYRSKKSTAEVKIEGKAKRWETDTL